MMPIGLIAQLVLVTVLGVFAVILFGTFVFSLRGEAAAPQRASSSAPEERPLALECVRLEGFEVLNLYQDVRQVRGLEGPVSSRYACTAKVRDPQTGAIRLLRVCVPPQKAR
jgi:hypothetical protein